MLAGPRPRVFTFLSALPDEEKNAMLTNLGASLVRTGSDVLLLDARSMSNGVASELGNWRAATLLEVARQERPLGDVVQATSQGFNIARLARSTVQARRQLLDAQHDAAQLRRLAHGFRVLAEQNDVVVVDADLGKDDSFPLHGMTNSEIVVQVAGNAASIKSAYGIIKRLNTRLGRRTYNVLVTGASEKEAKVVYENIAQAASRYLATQIVFMGSVPTDEHLKRAASLGRTVVDAFPLAGASVAFRRLAGRCTLSDLPASGLQMAG
jgi:flagellar biosynthesis protein FlhG